MNRTKYSAIKTVCAAGHKHDSKMEAGRCDQLTALEQGGTITHLVQQPTFKIEIDDRRVCDVILDFEYRMADSGLQIDEDVKGKDNPLSRLKRKLVEASYPGIVVTIWPVPVKRKTKKAKRVALEAIIRDKIAIVETGCWEWQGYRGRTGYGRVNRLGEALAHRLSYRIFKGEIDPTLEIDHLCRNRCCVNPEHLEAVSHAENMARADYKTTHRNRVKSECSRGHAFDAENTIIKTYGDRQQRACRTCENARRRKPLEQAA